MTTRVELSALARRGMESIPVYIGDATPCAVDLSDNTNLWGAPPAVLRALRSADVSVVARYPATYAGSLRDALLEHVGLSGADGIDVVTGCGSDDVLDSAMRAFAQPGECIAFSSPTFSMIPTFAQLNGLTPTPVPFAPGFELDAERLVDARAKLTYVCAPNNPTGTHVARSAIDYIVQNAAGVIVIDEAYAEFAPEVFVDLCTASDRVLVTRTFSKAFGMAGLRLGYGIGDRNLVRLVTRARGPYKVNALAERAARAALTAGTEGRDWVLERAAEAVENRLRLVDAVNRRGLTALPSAANFILIPTRRARQLASGLATRGVRVRVITGMPAEPRELADCEGVGLRVGVGPWPAMQTFLNALDEVVACA